MLAAGVARPGLVPPAERSGAFRGCGGCDYGGRSGVPSESSLALWGLRLRRSVPPAERSGASGGMGPIAGRRWEGGLVPLSEHVTQTQFPSPSRPIRFCSPLRAVCDASPAPAERFAVLPRDRRSRPSPGRPSRAWGNRQNVLLFGLWAGSVRNDGKNVPSVTLNQPPQNGSPFCHVTEGHALSPT